MFESTHSITIKTIAVYRISMIEINNAQQIFVTAIMIGSDIKEQNVIYSQLNYISVLIIYQHRMIYGILSIIYANIISIIPN